jgi:hypothetical protein
MYLEKYDPESYLLLNCGEADIHKLKAEVKYAFYWEYKTTIIHLVIPVQMCVHVRKY